jgi:hypothetical protein
MGSAAAKGVFFDVRPAAHGPSLAPKAVPGEVGVMNQRAFQFVAALACVLIHAATAFAWNGVTKVYEGDKDHLVVAGEYTGVNLTDGGQSFLHQAAVVCPAVAVVDKGVASNQGHCIATDRDGDKAFIVWQCRSPQPGARCEGDFQWTGGTGKYTGLRGKNVFNSGVVPKTTAGYSVWKGEWQLPD